MHDRERNRGYESLVVIKSARSVVSQIKIPRAVTQQPFLDCCLSEVIWWRSPLPLSLDPQGRQNLLSTCRTRGGNCTPASAGEKWPKVQVAPARHRQGGHSWIYPFLAGHPQQWHSSSFPHAFSLQRSSPSVCKHPPYLWHICWDQWEAYRNKRKNLNLQPRPTILSSSYTKHFLI